jgi:HNH endonuclease/CENP-B N-terminal DNA-binding domain
MGRSGQLNCTNDEVIMRLLNDPNYEVRADGTVWTRVTRTGKVSVQNIWRKAGHGRRGYWCIKYYGISLQAHRIIYARFNGQLEPDLVINHKDDCGYNNTPENLELVTQSKNNYHRFRKDGGKPPVMGNRVLDWGKIRNIRSLKLEGLSHNELARMFNISKGHVSQIVNNEIWIEGKLYHEQVEIPTPEPTSGVEHALVQSETIVSESSPGEAGI